jgi:chromosomal replication initiator protein
MVNAESIWQAALGELQLQMTKATFDTWVKQTHVIAHEDGAFIVGVQNGYAKDWLENRLLSVIKRTLTGIVGHSVEIRFVVQPHNTPKEEPVEVLRPMERLEEHYDDAPTTPYSNSFPDRSHVEFNPDYTFEKFVVGASNRLAHAASLAVAENPARAYNPLFLYGGVGLGKTHLLQAIGHHARSRGLHVLYVSSETFTNDLINSIRTKATDAFRDCYRNTDILLVDDIQFIAGKERTQEEFFHTFNALHSAGKQILISSDRPPQSILTLEERLASRFQWGLIADIQPPDLETRLAILRLKAENHGIQIEDEVMYMIARQMQNNIRELEGALNRVIAQATLTHEPITSELARRTLSSLVEHRPQVTVSDIIETVSHFYGIRETDLTGSSRKREFAVPRQIAMYLAREETGSSLPEIGSALGGRDHSTVLHGTHKISREIDEKSSLRRDLAAIREKLYREYA